MKTRWVSTLSCFMALSAFSIPQQPASPAFDQARAWTHLITQVGFGTRQPGSPGHSKCRDYLQAELAKTCDTVRLQPFEHLWSRGAERVKMNNIIGEQNWKNAKTRILLLAHWDTRPTADMEESQSRQRQPILGANDGASGVAVLLEAARVLKGTLPPDVGVMYLLVDGEDLGPDLSEMFLGASYFARNLPEQRPDYAILLDMIGDSDLVIPKEPNSARWARPLLNAVYEHAASIGLKETFPDYYGPTIEDDHIPLNRAGIPAIDLIDFDYPYWHTLADTSDKCSAESLGKVGKLITSWVRKNPPFIMPKRRTTSGGSVR